MKTLFLIRHAKSSWDDTALPDKDRPLDDRGRRDAPKMGKRLAKRDVKPDLILSSPARRALTTAEVIAKKLDYKLKDIVVDDRLYAGRASPRSAQKWLSPFAFPALSAPILRRTIAVRIRTAGLSTASVLPAQFARALNARPPAWRFGGGDALNISERGHRKHLPQ
jgi:hypothetical protein